MLKAMGDSKQGWSDGKNRFAGCLRDYSMMQRDALIMLWST